MHSKGDHWTFLKVELKAGRDVAPLAAPVAPFGPLLSPLNKTMKAIGSHFYVSTFVPCEFATITERLVRLRRHQIDHSG